MMQQKNAKCYSSWPAQKGAISQLQEFVQCSPGFQIPANYPVLQWSFDSQMANTATLEFSATVAFLLDGVPHHVAGGWQPQKKIAQRDTAERALALFAGKWGKDLQRNSDLERNTAKDVESDIGCLSTEELWQKVKQWFQKLRMSGDIKPSWSVCKEDGNFFATIEMTIHGVPHKLRGHIQKTEELARRDVAARVLWYLRAPGFTDAFELDSNAPAIAGRKIPAAPMHWAHDPAASEQAFEMAERKTAIMRVQNRLQQTFSKELRPGSSVWEWTYENATFDETDDAWPPFYKATVNIPVIGMSFTGEWRRGQREAQLDAIRKVTDALDKLDGVLK
jgi:hypothetical protein